MSANERKHSQGLYNKSNLAMKKGEQLASGDVSQLLRRNDLIRTHSRLPREASKGVAADLEKTACKKLAR